MINLVGFNGPEAHAVIFWQMNGVECTKTVCYSPEDEQVALKRFYTEGDFYHDYDQATVVSQDGESQIYTKMNGKPAGPLQSKNEKGSDWYGNITQICESEKNDWP